MTPESVSQWAATLQTAGGYGLAIVLAIVCRELFLRWERSQQARIEDGKLYAGALDKAATGIEKMHASNVSLEAKVAELRLKVDHLSERQ